ncbi:MAG: gamma-glutamylcyclotransferase family protein [Patescibacteria group bacterium]
MNRLIVIAFLAGVASSFIGGTLGLVAASPHTQERDQRIFIYDGLMNPLRRSYACRCWVLRNEVTLEGYIKTVRSVIETPSGRVNGGIINISDTELAHLDRHYGVPHDYRRTLINHNGFDTWLYVQNGDF